MLRSRRIAARALGAIAPALCGAAVLAPGPARAVAPAPPPTPPALSSAFDVSAYDVDGNTVLDQVSIETAVYPFLGPGRTEADVGAARAALEEAYRAKGYQSVVVELPQQSVASGVIRLHVVEAPVGRLRVTGSRYYSLEDIKRAAPALAEGKVPDFTQAQKEITAINRLPSRQVTPVLRPGRIPGTVDVDLKVADQQPFHASLDITNDHSPDTSSLRLTANVRYDNLFQLGHTLSATASTAPENTRDSSVYAGSYLAPIWGTPWSVLVYGYDSNSNVATIGGANVLGKGYAIGVRGLLQLPPIGDVSESVSLGVDYKHFKENLLFTKQAINSTVDYWPLNAVYSLQRQTDAATTAATFGVTAGTRGAGSDEATLQNKRAYARGNFVHVNIDLTHTQSLPLGLSAQARVSAQLSNQPLVSSEQFSAGGLTSVRGYLESEEVGDNGVFGSFELRSPLIAPNFHRIVDDWRAFAFVDGADLVILRALPGQQSEFTLYSTGVGTRFRLFDRVDGDVLIGIPLKTGRTSGRGQAFAVFDLKTEF